MDGNIYKYTSFEYFKDIVEYERFRFVNPFTEWDDKKEGFLFSHYDDRIEKIINESFEKKLREFAIKQLKNGWVNVRRVRNDGKDFYGIRATCFSNAGNSKALWRDRFHGGKSICVGFNKLFHKEEALNFLNSPVELLKVEYGDWEDDDFVHKILNECFVMVGEHPEFYFDKILKYKSLEFSFERESRLCFMLRNEQCHNCDIVYLKVPNIIRYIEKIYFNPCMDKSYREKIIEYCRGKGMNCNFFVYPEE